MTPHPDLGLPWRAHGTACDVDVEDRDGAMVADFMAPGPIARAQARAEYAVRAANAHTALVKALREAADALDRAAACFRTSDARDTIQSEADAARAALALAEERAP